MNNPSAITFERIVVEQENHRGGVGHDIQKNTRIPVPKKHFLEL